MGLYGDIGTQVNLVILCSFLWAWVAGMIIIVPIMRCVMTNEEEED